MSESKSRLDISLFLKDYLKLLLLCVISDFFEQQVLLSHSNITQCEFTLSS